MSNVEPSLILMLFLGISGSFYAWAKARTWAENVIALVLVAVFTGLENTAIMSYISRHVPSEQTGMLMGIMSSLGSVSRIVSPAVGGVLVERCSTLTSVFMCSLLALAGALLSLWGLN